MFFLFSISLFGADFITLKEYSKMLYENPRGISCKECHGADGSEQILGYYMKMVLKQLIKFQVYKILVLKILKILLIRVKTQNQSCQITL